MKRQSTLHHSLLLTLGLAFLLVPDTNAQTVLTLEQAKERALARTEEIQVARLRIEQAEHLVSTARAQRLPGLTVGAGYTHISETAGIDFQIPGLLSRSITFGDGNVYEASLTASAPIFTGFRLQHLEEAQRQNALTAREALRARQLETVHLVSVLYRKAQLARMSMNVFDGQLLYLDEQRRLLSHLLEEGQILAYDTLVLSTRLTALQVQRAGSETEYGNTLLTLSVFVAPDAPFDVEETIDIDDSFANAGHTALLAAALEHRPDVRQLAAQSDMHRELASAESGSLYPNISAMFSLRYGKPGVDQVANDWMGYYVAGVSLQWNIWAWGADKHRIEAKSLDARSSDLRLVQLSRKIGADISALLNEREQLKKYIALLDRQIAQEQQKHELLGARFQEGVASATELVDAETTLTTAMLARKQAIIQYAVKVNELATAVGQEN